MTVTPFLSVSGWEGVARRLDVPWPALPTRPMPRGESVQINKGQYDTRQQDTGQQDGVPAQLTELLAAP